MDILDIIQEEIKHLKEFDDSLLDNITDNDRIIMSKEKVIIPKNVNPDGKDRFSHKPLNSLWYGIGTEWVDWVESNMPEWREEYIHKIELNYDKILIVNDSNNEKFINKYMLKNEMMMDSLIDWGLVSQDYSGIELQSPHGMDWRYSWDVKGGAIWDTSAIKSIKLIG